MIFSEEQAILLRNLLTRYREQHPSKFERLVYQLRDWKSLNLYLSAIDPFLTFINLPQNIEVTKLLIPTKHTWKQIRDEILFLCCSI